MNKRTVLVLAVLAMVVPMLFVMPTSSAEGTVKVTRPVHTYSIVARDPETGEMGVAVQSHWFSVGSIVAWAEAGVGAVATQSLVDVSYGPLMLELLKAGKPPQKAMQALLQADSAPQVRQVAVVDAQGRVASHTGESCIPEAGFRTGPGYSVQANLMEKDTVWDAMAAAYESAQGPLAERMVAALEAAQAEGGDIRGKQSASLLVVRGEATGKTWEDRLIDLRVEDHREPVKEIKRLLQLHRAYEHMNAGDHALEVGDKEAANREYGSASRLAPGNLEMQYWYAVALANAGDVEAAIPVFREVFKGDPKWAELTTRLPKVDILQVSHRELERILAEAP